jgi:hypothetical protein
MTVADIKGCNGGDNELEMSSLNNRFKHAFNVMQIRPIRVGDFCPRHGTKMSRIVGAEDSILK